MAKKLPPNLGLMLLAVWLTISGLTTLVNFHFEGLGPMMAVLAIVSGVLIIIQR